MRIAVLTLKLSTNFGGVLQAYGLQKLLSRMGHDVCLLQGPDPKALPSVKTLARRTLKKILVDRRTIVFYEREMSGIRKNLADFIASNMKTRRISSLADAGAEGYDAYIVGSDQVWRKPYFTDNWDSPMRDAFLAFVQSPKAKKIAYAPSFGQDNVSEYSAKDIAECREALGQFDAVSVRESSGIDICRKEFGREAVQVVDPTMLLEKADYVAIAEKASPSPGRLLSYILDTNPAKRKKVAHIAGILGLDTFSSNLLGGPSQSSSPSIESWLRGFMDAEYVVTDSFHACVFSIIFEKPFIVLGNERRGLARIESLLKSFGIDNRLVCSTDDINAILRQDIPWDSVRGILAKKRREGLEFLRESLQ